MPKTKVIDTRDRINEKMESEGRTLRWLADQTEINYNSLYSCIKRKIFPLNKDWLKRINKALETEYELFVA